jgi:phosphopantothenoylcysteine decarboxylase/phosphopantothenate--cysteine ligase
MDNAADKAVRDADVFIASAAVADYRPAAPADRKIKKTEESLSLELTRTPDVLAGVAALDERPFTVGFAAETNDVEANARKKLEGKRLDMIAANQVGEGIGFDCDDNELHVIWPDGDRRLGPADKCALADELIALIGERLGATGE